MNLFFRKIKVPEDEFLFQFQTHPNYPSALAFSDTLSFLNVKNEVYNVEKKFWHQLPNTFITIYEDNYVFVEKFHNDYLIFSENKKKVTEANLFEKSEDTVFIIEEIEKSEVNYKFNFKYVFLVILVLGLLYSLFDSILYKNIYNFLSAIGVYISIELFKNKFGNKSEIVERFCSSNKSSNDINNCSKIFGSDTINIFGLKLSDFSLVYFISIYIIGVINFESSNLLKYVSCSTILVVFYSLYVQLFKEKIICKICILIILILISQISISVLFFKNFININFLFFVSLIFITSFFFVMYINNTLIINEKYYLLNLKNNKFKKNYDIFKRELLTNSINLKVENNEFLLGNKNSKIRISIITNPYCGYCIEAYEIAEKILQKYDEISIQIRFNYNDSDDDNLKLIIKTFKNIYMQGDYRKLFESIHFWHNQNSIAKFKKTFKEYVHEVDLNGIIDLANENKIMGLTYTPQFLINNYLYSRLYEREDIFYFLDELIEDVDVIR